MKKKFDHKILVIGYGSVSQCTIPILFEKMDISYANVTVIDFADKAEALKKYTDQGLKYFQKKIEKDTHVVAKLLNLA